MANKLYRKVHQGREFAQLETFNRATQRVVLVHQIDRKTISRAKWNEELARAQEADKAPRYRFTATTREQKAFQSAAVGDIANAIGWSSY